MRGRNKKLFGASKTPAGVVSCFECINYMNQSISHISLGCPCVYLESFALNIVVYMVKVFGYHNIDDFLLVFDRG